MSKRKELTEQEVYDLSVVLNFAEYNLETMLFSGDDTFDEGEVFDAIETVRRLHKTFEKELEN